MSNNFAECKKCKNLVLRYICCNICKSKYCVPCCVALNKYKDGTDITQYSHYPCDDVCRKICQYCLKSNVSKFCFYCANFGCSSCISSCDHNLMRKKMGRGIGCSAKICPLCRGKDKYICVGCKNCMCNVEKCKQCNNYVCDYCRENGSTTYYNTPDRDCAPFQNCKVCSKEVNIYLTQYLIKDLAKIIQDYNVPGPMITFYNLKCNDKRTLDADLTEFFMQ